MIPLFIYIITIFLLLSFNLLVYIYAKKKGEKDFLDLLFAAGLMGKIDAFNHYNQYASKQGIVFVGDSITQDFNVYEYFPNQLVYNRGIGGDTSKGVLTRLKESVFDLYPKQVFLQIGTNDLELIGDGVENIYNRIKDIINKIKSFDENIDVYLISVYPVNKNIDPKTVGRRTNNDIKSLNNLLSQIQNVKYVDINKKLLLDDALNPNYTLEGLHLNQKGYLIVREELLKYMS